MNLTIKIKLKLNKLFIFKKINNNTALSQDDIVVAMGMIIMIAMVIARNIFIIPILGTTE